MNCFFLKCRSRTGKTQSIAEKTCPDFERYCVHVTVHTQSILQTSHIHPRHIHACIAGAHYRKCTIYAGNICEKLASRACPIRDRRTHERRCNLPVTANVSFSPEQRLLSARRSCDSRLIRAALQFVRVCFLCVCV